MATSFYTFANRLSACSEGGGVAAPGGAVVFGPILRLRHAPVAGGTRKGNVGSADQKTQTTQLPSKAMNYDTQFLSQSSTKVLIQRTATRRYLGSSGLWIEDIEQARAYRSGSAAMEEVGRLNLGKVQLVLIRNIKVCEVIPVAGLAGA